ncbi:hypothetical protein ISS37_06595 [candidate division KSB1 bacterium]|nr:hypothetical protein [candidate division KSB1 bacterium]
MCGICGVIYLDRGRSVGSEMLRGMSQTLTHRGPDDEGLFINRNVGLGMRRLAIIDVAGGHQPISNENDAVHIVYNGELYNFKEIRDFLIRKGHHFKTRTDTESILHLYEEEGLECFKHLNGMFAFAIWDSNERSLLLRKPKQGFRLSIKERFEKELKHFCWDVLLNSSRLNDYFNKDYIQEMLISHFDKKRDFQYQIWTLLVFAVWLDNVSIMCK